MRIENLVLLALLAVSLSDFAHAGSLSLGKPVIQNNQYTFPVNLQGSGEGVAALDFRLAYDPAVFAPVSAQTGSSAATAQKQVSSNVAEPGEFIVVMMGFNQNVVEPGTVVQVVMEKIGEPANGQSELAISEPTMATSEGVEIDSIGQTSVVKFGEEKSEPDKVNEKPTTPEDKGSGSESPDSPTPVPSKPAGGFRFIVAEETEHKTKATDTPGSAPSKGSNPSESASGVRPGDSSPPLSATGELPTGSPQASTLAEKPTAAGAIPEPDTAISSTEEPSADALVTSSAVSKTPAAVPKTEDAGNRGTVFVTLLMVALALPVSALIILKMLR